MSLARRLAPALGLLALVQPRPALAQGAWSFHRALGLMHMYDDNLFSTALRQPDEVWRLSPSLGLERKSGRSTFAARYGCDAEFFRRHAELNTPAARQAGSLDLAWAPAPRTDLRATVSYVDGQSPRELNALTGFQSGRVRAHRLAAVSTVSRRWGARSTLRAEQSFVREQVRGEARLDTQTASVAWERRLGAIDQGRLRYGVRRFAVGEEATLAHVVTAGWSRAVTPLLHFEVEGGPYLSPDTAGAEAAAGVAYRSRRAELSLSGVRTQTTVLGHAGPVLAEGLTVSVRRRLTRSLRVGSSPSVFRVRGSHGEALVRRVDIEVTWSLTPQIALTASHQFAFQRGGVQGDADRDAEVSRNTFVVGLSAAAGGH